MNLSLTTLLELAKVFAIYRTRRSFKQRATFVALLNGCVCEYEGSLPHWHNAASAGNQNFEVYPSDKNISLVLCL